MSRAGFTLLELLVVLVLLAITASAAVPAFLGDAQRSAEQRVATALAEQMVAARDAARESGSATTFTLSLSDGRFWTTTRDSSLSGVLPLTGGITIVAQASDRLEIRYEPTGLAPAASITIHGARDLTVRSASWTGDVSIENGRAR